MQERGCPRTHHGELGVDEGEVELRRGAVNALDGEADVALVDKWVRPICSGRMRSADVNG